MAAPDETANASSPIVAAAFEMIVSAGLAELTLRPLAEKVGVGLTGLTQAMGSKVQLIARLVDGAIAQDDDFRQQWAERIRAMAPIAPGMRAVLVETVLDDWIGHHRHLPCLLIDLVQEAGRHGDSSPVLARWLDNNGRFWAELLFNDVDQADVALGYILDEVGFSLCSLGHPAYRMIRSLCLNRLVDGLYPPPREGIGAGRHLEQWIAAAAPDRSYPDAPDRSKRGLIAAEAGRLIVNGGVEALTHRSVAAAAGAPASTVVYHFGSRDDLVVAALHAIVTNFRHNLGETTDRSRPFHANYAASRDLIRATSIIAIAAARHPGLAHHALDMRRRRGENLTSPVLWEMGLPAGREADRCTSQVVSVALFGMRMVAMARGRDDHAHVQAAFARLAPLCR